MLLVRRFAALGWLVCLAAAASACGSRQTAPVTAAPQLPADPVEPPTTIPETTPDRDECTLIAAHGAPIAAVALTDRIDPSNAPRPSNESERLVFRQLYDTLVRVDCSGRLVPALATSWRLEADGRTWILTLRDDARFSDGAPVVANDVRASWRRSNADELLPQVRRLVDSIVPVGDRTLAIQLRWHRADLPLALAHPDLAIAKSPAGSRWPLGSRGARVATDTEAVPSIAATVIALHRDHLPDLRFLVASRDPRDLLDHGVDLVVTRDPTVLDYAATLPQFQSIPLPWHRTHVLLTPAVARTVRSFLEHVRGRLADDAVRGEAKGTQGPSWLEKLPECGIAIPQARPPSTPIPRIVYGAGDAVARDLAERFAGVAGATYQRAAGLSRDAFVAALRRGAEAGYILSVDYQPLDPCRELLVLLDTAPWLDLQRIVPLVDTRLQAIVRRSRSGLDLEWNGGLVIGKTKGPSQDSTPGNSVDPPWTRWPR